MTASGHLWTPIRALTTSLLPIQPTKSTKKNGKKFRLQELYRDKYFTSRKKYLPNILGNFSK